MSENIQIMNQNLDRAQIPTPAQPRPFNFPLFEKFKLANGLNVVFAAHTKLPLITMQLVIHSGAPEDPPGKEGTASLLSDLLPEGTKTKSSYEISHGFEQLGTQFSTHSDWNGSYLEMICTKAQLTPSMDLLTDVLFNPVFENEEIERQRKRLLTQRLKLADSAARIAQEKFAETLYGNSRFSQPVSGNTAQIKNLSKAGIQEFYDTHYIANNATLIIVGDLSLDEVHQICETYFVNWKTASLQRSAPKIFTQPTASQMHLIHKNDARQAELCMGHIGISRDNPDYFAVILLNQILGGYFLSRLNQNLREDKGYTYGISSRFISRKNYSGPFIVGSAIDSDNVHTAVKEIIKEIELLREEEVSADELEQAKGYLNGIFPIAFESGSQIAAGLSNIVIFGLEKDYYRTYREKLSEVTSAEILQAAQKYLFPDKLSTVICTDKNAAEQTLSSSFDINVSEFLPEE